jgi:hypothetical protein
VTDPVRRSGYPAVNDILPMKGRRDPAKLGGDIGIARCELSLTGAMCLTNEGDAGFFARLVGFVKIDPHAD